MPRMIPREFMWLVYAILGALCAALIPVLGKLGMRRVDSNLATAMRSVVQAAFVVGVVLLLGSWRKTAPLTFPTALAIIATGICGGLSWLFYFKAIDLGTASQVAPVDKLSVPIAVVLAFFLLGERPTWYNWTGVCLIALGAYLAALPRS